MELRDYLGVMWARKWTIIQSVVIVTLVALVVSLLQTPTYNGEAKILVSEKDTGAALLGTALSDFSRQPERGLATEVELMQLRPLAEGVVRKLGLQESPDQLLTRVKVSAVGQTDLVTVDVTDADPQRAADIANAMAQAYVDASKQAKRESIDAAANEVQLRLDQAQKQILDLGQKIQASGKSDQLGAELSIATDLYSTLAEKLETLRVNEQLEVGNGRVVAAAVVNTDKVAPKPVRNGLLGIAVGLVFGVSMAFLLEYLDNSIKSTEEAERVFGAPVLGHIVAESFDPGDTRHLTLVQQPGSRAAESYRVLRNSLDFVNFQQDTKTLLITSAAPAEGKSTVAANLAVGLAQTGKKVVLLSCDFRRPTTQQFFDVSNAVGLSDVLTGGTSLKGALQRPGSEELLVLTSGRMPPNPSELLGSNRMKEVVQSLEEWADWVIIDSPPLLAVADPAAVARWVDGVLLVSRGGYSTRDSARKARELLDKVGARVVGVVVWGLEESATGNGYGYYRDGKYGAYYYADYYSAPGEKSVSESRAGSGADDTEAYVSERSPRRQFATFLARFTAGLLGFLLVATVLLVALYFLDAYFGWGLAQQIRPLLPL